MPGTPHLAIPFALAAGGTFTTVEQDSPDHVAQRVQTVAMTLAGHRDDDPTFGVPDHVFRTPGADLDAFRDALTAGEPAASLALERATTIDDLRTDRLAILIQES